LANQIELLARDLLDEQEWRLAQRLATVLGDDTLDAGGLVLEILPVFWEGDSSMMARTLRPDSIYRPLYYVHMYAGLPRFGKFTRIFLDMICGHLEACLEQLTQSPPKSRHPTGLFGTLASSLYRMGVIPQTLADQVSRFNKVANVPSTHLRSDERTFSVSDSALAFVMMRKLSIQLSAALKARGVNLPARWKGLDDSWLTWDRRSSNRPAAGMVSGDSPVTP
jgi:hypothetical protein